MKFIDSSVEIMKEENPLIKIEKIGRICYKSESDYTIDTAIAFIKGLIKRGHMSVLEHAVFVFEGLYSTYRGKPFVNCTYVYRKDFTRRLISCNLRAIIEQGYYDLQNALIKHYPQLSEIFDMEKLNWLNGYEFVDVKLVNLLDYKNLTPEEAKAHLYTTFQFVTDRGVSHEMVRHRIASYTQESTRYCNYSNDKFGNELTFIRPATFDNWEPECRVIYMQSLEKAEKEYMELTAKGLPAQFARGVLPTDVKTIIVMTANYKEMNHFFDLRSRGVTGSPHPNMLRVASMADELFYTEYKELLENVYKEPMEKTLPID